MNKNESKTAKLNSNFTGMMAVVMLSVLFIVIGIIMYAYPDMKLKNFTYVISGFFLVGGAWEVCRYFLKEEYRNVANYDFSAGLLLLILGCISIVKEPALTKQIYLLLGALVLVQGIIMVQYFVDMIALKSYFWWLMLLICAAQIGLSVCILLDVGGLFATQGWVLFGSLFGSGALGLIALFIVALRIRRFEQSEVKHKLRELEDDFTDFVPAHKSGEVVSSYISEKESNDFFEDEGIEDEEPEVDTNTLKQKILSLKSKRKTKETNESIFEDEEVM